ncbi:MAG: hypothetical protein GF308_20625, partial [Candidatus Heimdallarchaeota archaeon]|nr:hypothetical protein [Candidatus Heimdallarchaeota archaeon]
MIKITLPMTGELIKKNMQKIVAKIQEETEWNLERELKNININFGKVPEYHESFG